jgi:hypothetical protein
MTNPNVEFDLKLNAQKAMAGLKKYGNSITRFAKRGAARLKKIALQFAKVGLAAGAMGLVIGVAVVKSQLALMDATAKASDAMGIEIERLQELRHAANLTGVANEQLDMAIQKMVKNIADAADGAGIATDALNDLELQAADLARMSPHKAFLAIAEAMGTMDTSGKRLQATLDIFGRSAAILVNTLALGREGLLAAGEEAQRLGVFGRNAAAGAEAADDAMDNLTKATVNFAASATADIAPYIELLAKDLTDAITGAKDATDDLSDSTGGLAGVMGILADTLHTVGLGYKFIELQSAKFFDSAKSGKKALEVTLLGAEDPRDQLGGLPPIASDIIQEEFEAKLIGKTVSKRIKIQADARKRKKAAEDEAKKTARTDILDIQDLGFGLAGSAAEQAEERTRKRFADTADERKRRTERIAREKAFTSVLPPRTEEFPGLVRPEVPRPVVPEDLFAKKQKEEAGGFQATFESLQGLQRRISQAAASSPEERAAKSGEKIATATGKMATGIDKLVVIAEKESRDPKVIAVFGP